FRQRAEEEADTRRGGTLLPVYDGSAARLREPPPGSLPQLRAGAPARVIGVLQACSTMRDLSPEDRPREQLLRHGASAVGDNELVALVLGSGGPRLGALQVANELLRAHGGLHGMARASCRDLGRVPGVGPARAAQLVAALELGRRTLMQT